MVVCTPASTIFNHVKISSYFTSYILWKHHQLSQANKWPNVIFLKVTLRYPILSFELFSIYLWISFISSQYKYICEIYCLFHNGNNIWFTLYILLIVFNHFVKIVPFFTTFQKFRNKSRKNTILKIFKKYFFAFFGLFMLIFLFRNKFKLFQE